MHNEGFNGRKKFEETKHDEVNIIIKNIFNKHKPHIKKVTIYDADLILDTKRSTDLVINADGKNLGAGLRIRRANITFRDFTIRKSYYNSSNTEVNKIHHTNFYFYGWLNNKNQIEEFIFVDIKKLMESGLIKKYKHMNITNKDDENSFFSIPLADLKHFNCLIEYKINNEDLLIYQEEVW